MKTYLSDDKYYPIKKIKNGAPYGVFKMQPRYSGKNYVRQKRGKR